MAQVKVVSKGMRWTQEAQQKALQNHQYIKVGPKPGYLLLSGAVGRWKKPETAGDVYVPSLRVAGNPALIRQLFIGLGVSAADIDRHLAASYNARNYNTTMKGSYDAEVAAYKGFKGQKDAVKRATGGPSVSLSELQYFVDELSKATTVARTTTGSPRGTSPRGRRARAGRVKPLAERLADATNKGKVLDVSKMNLATGTGIKMTNRPGPGSKKVGVAGLNIISSDPARYAAAVRQLGPQHEGRIAQYNAAVARKTTVAAPALPVAAAPTLPAMSPIGGYVAPLGSPLVGGVALPTIPGSYTLPVGSPAGSPFR